MWIYATSTVSTRFQKISKAIFVIGKNHEFLRCVGIVIMHLHFKHREAGPFIICDQKKNAGNESDDDGDFNSPHVLEDFSMLPIALAAYGHYFFFQCKVCF